MDTQNTDISVEQEREYSSLHASSVTPCLHGHQCTCTYRPEHDNVTVKLEENNTDDHDDGYDGCAPVIDNEFKLPPGDMCADKGWFNHVSINNELGAEKEAIGSAVPVKIERVERLSTESIEESSYHDGISYPEQETKPEDNLDCEPDACEIKRELYDTCDAEQDNWGIIGTDTGVSSGAFLPEGTRFTPSEDGTCDQDLNKNDLSEGLAPLENTQLVYQNDKPCASIHALSTADGVPHSDLDPLDVGRSISSDVSYGPSTSSTVEDNIIRSDKDESNNDQNPYHNDSTSKTIHKCQLCGKEFTLSKNLNRHVKQLHKKSGVDCVICHKSLRDQSALKVHLRLHSNDKFSCDICEKSFTQAGQLKLHMNKHTGHNKFICDVCGMGFNKRDHFEAHINRHNNQKPYACPKCEKGFYRNTDLLRHEASCGSHAKTFECEQCNRCCRSKYLLTRHMRSHRTHRDKFLCEKCGNVYSFAQSLHNHKKVCKK